MKKLRYIVFSFLISLITYHLFFTPCRAISEFESHYSINYQVNSNGQTSVSQEIKLKNKLKNVYATEYTLSIGSTEITDIKARDNNQTLDTKVESLDSSTKIAVFLKEKILGKNKEQTFFLSYKTPDFAYVKGKVLEVGIPLLSQLEEIETYNISLNVPSQFGETTNILPQVSSSKQQDGYYLYLFDKATLQKVEGIRATFGTEQIFKFSLKYHLKNPGTVPIKTQITLPPDTPFQRLSYQKLEPAPEDIEIDADGNWLATYKLQGSQKLDITAEGVAKVFLTAKSTPGESFGYPGGEKKQDYLSPQPFWETDDVEIKKLSERLKTPHAIYAYLVENFIYDYGRASAGQVKRFGAKNALENPASAICMEFTDTFIALSRAAGIPAREVNGFAYTQNPKLRPLSLDRDVLHAWPEYWNEKEKTWIPVDPTWGNTTGGLDFFHKRDLDHFAFIFHGLSSEEPLPPGSFKLEENHQKDINIDFAEQYLESLETEIKLDAPEKLTGGTNKAATLTIENKGTSALYQKGLKIYLQKDENKIWERQEKILILPPFDKEEIKLNLSAPLFTREKKLKLTAEFDNQTVQKEIEITPLINFQIIKWGIGIITGLFLSFLIIKLGYVIAKKTSFQTG